MPGPRKYVRSDDGSRCLLCQVREQQAQEASEAQAADLREAVRAANEEASDLRAQLATVVPRDQLTAAEQRIKVMPCCFLS